MRRTRVIIQSRLNSSRLPGKAMLTIAGMPLVELVARRAGRSGHEVVVATSVEPYDDRIALHCTSVGIEVVRGSLDDVLSRFVAGTADLDTEDRVVRLTGDNPVADADLVDELIGALNASDHTYGRVDIDRVPEGLGAEVFTVGALRKAHATTRAAYDREHVTPWLRRELGELLFVPAQCPTDVLAYRATVDTLSDYVRVSSLFDGVEDPIGSSWVDLMASLVARVDARGHRVPSMTTSTGPQSKVVLSARRFSENPHGFQPAELTESLRALLADAVDRGVTHVDVGRGDGHGNAEELLRACSEPALTKRFAVILRLPGADETDADARTRSLAVEASVERSFATLGRRGVDTLAFPDAKSAADGWARAREYVRAGLVKRLGMVVTSPEDVRWAGDQAGLGWIEVPSTSQAAASCHAELADLADRGTIIAWSTATTAGPPRWASTLVVCPTSPEELNELVAAATG